MKEKLHTLTLSCHTDVYLYFILCNCVDYEGVIHHPELTNGLTYMHNVLLYFFRRLFFGVNEIAVKVPSVFKLLIKEVGPSLH